MWRLLASYIHPKITDFGDPGLPLKGHFVPLQFHLIKYCIKKSAGYNKKENTKFVFSLVD